MEECRAALEVCPDGSNYHFIKVLKMVCENEAISNYVQFTRCSFISFLPRCQTQRAKLTQDSSDIFFFPLLDMLGEL